MIDVGSPQTYEESRTGYNSRFVQREWGLEGGEINSAAEMRDAVAAASAASVKHRVEHKSHYNSYD